MTSEYTEKSTFLRGIRSEYQSSELVFCFLLLVKGECRDMSKTREVRGGEWVAVGGGESWWRKSDKILFSITWANSNRYKHGIFNQLQKLFLVGFVWLSAGCIEWHIMSFLWSLKKQTSRYICWLFFRRVVTFQGHEMKRMSDDEKLRYGENKNEQGTTIITLTNEFNCSCLAWLPTLAKAHL